MNSPKTLKEIVQRTLDKVDKGVNDLNSKLPAKNHIDTTKYKELKKELTSEEIEKKKFEKACEAFGAFGDKISNQVEDSMKSFAKEEMRRIVKVATINVLGTIAKLCFTLDKMNN